MNEDFVIRDTDVVQMDTPSIKELKTKAEAEEALPNYQMDLKPEVGEFLMRLAMSGSCVLKHSGHTFIYTCKVYKNGEEPSDLGGLVPGKDE